MAIESGIGVSVRYVAESTTGVIPTTPTMTVLRATSRNVNLGKNLLESAEVSSHGEETDVRHGFQQVSGTLNTELLTGNADAFLAAALRSTWSSAISEAVICGATGPATFTRASGSFVSDGFQPGDIIVTTGFPTAVNNGKWMILTVSALSITVAVSSVASKQVQTEAADGDSTVTLAGRRLTTGTTKTTFSIERAFTGTSKFQQFMGVTPNGLTLGVQPESIPTLEFPVIGLKSQAMTSSTVASAVTAAPTGSPYDSFSGGICIGSNLVGVVTGLNLNLALNRELVPVVGDYYSPDIFEGRIMVSGEVTVMFENDTLYNLFYNETESKMGLRLNDPNGTDFHGIYLPRTKFNAAPLDPGQTGPVIQTMQFRCLRDATLGYTIGWFRSNAS